MIFSSSQLLFLIIINFGKVFEFRIITSSLESVSCELCLLLVQLDCTRFGVEPRPELGVEGWIMFEKSRMIHSAGLIFDSYAPRPPWSPTRERLFVCLVLNDASTLAGH